MFIFNPNVTNDVSYKFWMLTLTFSLPLYCYKGHGLNCESRKKRAAVSSIRTASEIGSIVLVALFKTFLYVRWPVGGQGVQTRQI